MVRQAHTPTVSWFELFYDLVVVAAVSLTNDFFLRQPSFTSALLAVACMTALAWVWFLTTLYNNVFPGQDTLRRLVLVVQMAAVIVAALAVDQEHGVSGRAGLVAYGVALALLALLILRGAHTTRTPVRLGAVVPIGLAAVICWIGAFADNIRSIGFLLAAVAVSMVPILVREYAAWQQRSQLRLDHLRERLGLFVLIILGEGFAQLVTTLHATGSIPRSDLFALMFLLTFALWWIYFDGTFAQDTDLALVRWRLTLLGHLTLVFGIGGTLDILILLTAQEGAELGEGALTYFVACVATVLVSFALLRYSTKGRLGLAGWVQAASGVVILAVGLVLPRGGEEEVLIVVGVCAAVVIGNAVLAVWTDKQSSPVRSGT